MKRFEIFYNPYEQETRILVNNHDIKEEPAYSRLRKIIEKGTPLQSWIDPIPHKSWESFINEMVSSDCYDEVEISFHGRKIDYEDLQRACEAGNAKRKKEKQLLIKYMPLVDELSDAIMAKNVETVKQQILSQEFATIVNESKDNSSIKAEYERLASYYGEEKDKEFKIVFAGVFSCGKSTILNTLIRHEVLPTAGGTCTAKNCRIKHNSSLGKKVSLTCYNGNGDMVVPTEVFENDEDCLKRFWEITPLGAKESVPPEVYTIEINLNLLHLYPSPEMEKEFNLVIVDTPGCNSLKTAEADKTTCEVEKQETLENEHMKIALEAISSGEKEMVVICTNAMNDITTDFGVFLRAIYKSMEEDAGNFNDRFVFAQNLCDKASYTAEGECLEKKKNDFAQTLMNPNQYGFKKGENAPDFVPRIMMLSAGVQLAVHKGISSLDEDEADMLGKKEQSLYDAYKAFAKNIKRKNGDYFLTQVCDIPEYRKIDLHEQFEVALKDGNMEKAVSLQTGMKCLEIVIKDYIERYAYPFKIRALRKSFRPLLEAVAAQVKAESALLEKYKADLEEKELAQQKGEHGKDEQEEIKKALLCLEKKINEQKEKISKVLFDKSKFQAISNEVDKDITPLREALGVDKKEGKTYTKDEMNKKMIEVQETFSKAFQKASTSYETVEKGYQVQLEEICKELRHIYDEMRRDEKYNFAGYNFESSLGAQRLKELDINALRKEVEDTKENKTITKRNTIKDEVYKWWQFGKKINQYFAPETIEVTEDYYSMEPILNHLMKTADEFESLCKETTEKYETDISRMKDTAIDMAEEIPKDIKAVVDKIKDFQNNLRNCGRDISKLNKLAEAIGAKKNFLESMIHSIEIGGGKSVQI